MNIKFKWNTSKINDRDKEKIESELKQKISFHISQSIKMSIEELYVNLFDERIEYQVTGSAYTIKKDEKIEVIKEITINPGFHMEFANL